MEIRVLDEDAVGASLRARVGELLAGILDDGPRYRGEGWRTLRPCFRVVALDDGAPVGQVSGFAVEARPEVRLIGLGDLAVDPGHRMRGLARRLCAAATTEARRRGAGVMLAKTRPMRKVLGELGFVAVERFDYYYEEGGACVRHPDWMALVIERHAIPVRLEEGDF
jgi:GNAT superfamily N-acetyltransferase